jgi:hypothetical protein
MADHIRLLGFAAEADAERLQAALSAVPGPSVSSVHAGGIAALVQSDRSPGRLSRKRDAALRALFEVQRRLEVACLQGAFLPADPSRNLCARAKLPVLLADAAAQIAAALKVLGGHHQWDVILRWLAEPVLEARRGEIQLEAAGQGRSGLAEAVGAALGRERALREAALQAALSRVARAVKPAGAGVTETGFTVLLPAAQESALETALGALGPEISEGASADLRGPLPPISFAAVRVESAAPKEVAQAWQMLGLPDQVDGESLRRHWHACAARLHPDHGMQEDAPIREAGAAFRLLRGLLPENGTKEPWSLPALQRRGALRLQVPAPSLEMLQ